MDGRELTPEQQAMVEVWERHMAAEFKETSVDATMATMTSEPFVNHVPVMTGGVGSGEVRHFYGTCFIPGHPPNTDVVPVARTVAKDRIIDELIYKFTHTIEMPWILPGVPPTGKRVEVAVIVVVQFEGGKIAGERIYWDQASVLAQIGLIDAEKLPATGIEASRKSRRPRTGTIQQVNHAGESITKWGRGALPGCSRRRLDPEPTWLKPRVRWTRGRTAHACLPDDVRGQRVG